MGVHIQTAAFLMNYINKKLNEGNLSVESVHVSDGYIDENGNLILTFNNSAKDPITIELDQILQEKDLENIKEDLKNYIESSDKDFGEI